ncbi:SAV_6107 family HEPN domain-containing protein [Streptomyces abyssomicinicus]|uniref:SAV_6107 family HEPN domain-containing protein n=1 Tax=Streptomyces abyssomicinicus TaxID=574929 RepID=UPI0013DE9978
MLSYDDRRFAMTHPVARRASAPPAGLDLLSRARTGLDRALLLTTPNERYAAAHLAALRGAAAVLAVRADPLPEPRRRRRAPIRSAWEVLAETAPELAEWAAFFAAGADRRARAEADLPHAVSVREADDLIRDVAAFLRLVERATGLTGGDAH